MYMVVISYGWVQPSTCTVPYVVPGKKLAAIKVKDRSFVFAGIFP